MANVLVCTLGAQPQVVTLSLDLLARQGRQVERLVVVHTSPEDEPVRSARRQVEQALAGRRGLVVQFETVADDRGPVSDLATPNEAAAYLRTLYHIVLVLKQAGCRVDLNLSGGRKPMSLLAMVVAQLLFNSDDRLWYLLSSDALRRVRPDATKPRRRGDPVRGARAALEQCFPVLTPLGGIDDPWDAIRYQQEHRLRADLVRKQEFVEHWLTPAERELAALATTSGLDNATLAERMGKSRKTINNQLTSIYDKLHEFLGFRENVPTDRAVLAAELGPYFVLEASRRMVHVPMST